MNRIDYLLGRMRQDGVEEQQCVRVSSPLRRPLRAVVVVVDRLPSSAEAGKPAVRRDDQHAIHAMPSMEPVTHLAAA